MAETKVVGGQGFARNEPECESKDCKFETKTTTIYATADGSNKRGDGSRKRPYRTFQRALCDVPQIIKAGHRFIVDITDLGVELLPQNWSAPSIVGDSNTGIDPAPFKPYLIRTGPLVIRALPQLALPGTEAIISAADAAVVAAVGPGLCSLTIGTPRAAWAAGALKGKQIIRTVGSSSATCCIYDSSATELFLCNTPVAVNGAVGALVLATDETINIVEPSATLTAPPGTMNNDPITWSMTAGVCFQGIKFVCTVPDADNGALNLNGNVVTPFFELCDIDGLDAVLSGGIQVGLFSTTMRDYCNSFSSQLTPRRSYWNIPEGFFVDGALNQFRQTVFEAGTSIQSAGAGATGPTPTLELAFLNCWFLGAPGDAITLMAPTRLDMTTCQIDNSAGNAITASGPCLAVLSGVTGSGNTGYGVQTDDGAHVQVDAAVTVGNADGRAFTNGAAAPVAAWAGVTFNNADPITFSRVWEP